MFTALTLNNIVNEQTDEGVSSLVDTWILVRDIEFNGERNRGMYIMKARGMKHSNQVREFIITSQGLDLIEVYMGPEGVLTGSAREIEELRDKMGRELSGYALDRKDREINRKRKNLETKIAVLKDKFESIAEELEKAYKEEEVKQNLARKSLRDLTRIRRDKK
jgi:circadian clock protein KaiC